MTLEVFWSRRVVDLWNWTDLCGFSMFRKNEDEDATVDDMDKW